MFFKIFIGYLILINLIGFCSMGVDKRKAKRGKFRIPEKRLFLYAILGGALGSLIGMHLFHHKTKHWYFKFGMPLLCILWVVLLCFLFIRK